MLCLFLNPFNGARQLFVSVSPTVLKINDLRRGLPTSAQKRSGRDCCQTKVRCCCCQHHPRVKVTLDVGLAFLNVGGRGCPEFRVCACELGTYVAHRHTAPESQDCWPIQVKIGQRAHNKKVGNVCGHICQAGSQACSRYDRRGKGVVGGCQCVYHTQHFLCTVPIIIEASRQLTRLRRRTIFARPRPTPFRS